MFDQLWKGKFRAEAAEGVIKERMEKLNQPYRNCLKKLFLDDINRLEYTNAGGRMFLESSEQINERINKKLDRKYRFKTHPIRERDQAQFIANKLIARVYENIKEKELKGIDQSVPKMIIDKMLDIN